MTNAPAPPLLAEPGVRFGLANVVIVVALFAAALTRLDLTGTEALVVLVAGLAGTGLPWLVTAALGLVAWAMVTGFAENQYGLLTFTGHDLVRLLVFVVACSALPAAVRHLGPTAQHQPAHHQSLRGQSLRSRP